MSNSKQTTLNLTTSLLAFVINAGINFFLTPFMISKLGNEAYGFIGLANDIVNYASILTMALNSMSSRFVSIEYHRGNIEKAKTYINSVFVANLVIAGVVALVGVFVVWKLEYIINIPSYLMGDVKITFALVFVNYLLSVIISIFACAPFIKNKMNLIYTRNMISYILKLAVTILLITIFDVKIFFISLTTLICTAYLAFANVIIFKKLLPEFKISFKGFKLSAVKTILASGVWMSLLSLSNMLINGLNSLLANKFISTIANGYLSVSKTIPNYINQLGTQLGTVFAPQFTEKYAKGDIDGLIEDAKKSIKIMSFIIIVPVAGFIAVGKDFYSLWVSTYSAEEISTIQTLSIIVSIPPLLNALVYPLIQINTACNKVRVPVIVTFLVGVANILIVFPLGAFDKLTLELLTIFSSLFMALRYILFQPYYAAKIINVKLSTFFKPVYKNIAIFLLVLCVFVVFNNLFLATSWLKLIAKIIILGLLGYAVSLVLIFNKSEQSELINTIKSKIKR